MVHWNIGETVDGFEEYAQTYMVIANPFLYPKMGIKNFNKPDI